MARTDRIYIDDRKGSAELKPCLDAIGTVKTRLCHLQYGDFKFHTTNGPEPGEEIEVGIERKTVSEMVGMISAGKAQRFAGSQLPGMLRRYRFCFLVVEGDFRENDRTQQLEIWNEVRGRWYPGRVHYRALRSTLLTLRLQAGVQVIHTLAMRDTAFTLESMFHWFQKPWDQHSSHQKFPLVPGDRVSLVEKASFERRVAKELPHVGWKRARQIEDRFGSVEGMVNASVHDWELIDGVTPEKAVKIWKLWRKIR